MAKKTLIRDLFGNYIFRKSRFKGDCREKQGKGEVITAAAAYTLMPRWMEKTNRAGYRELT
jgi:hypothetical protein